MIYFTSDEAILRDIEQEIVKLRIAQRRSGEEREAHRLWVHDGDAMTSE